MVIIKIEKRHVYVFVALVVLLIGIFVIRAYGSNIPSTFGHSAGEIDVTIGGQTKNLQQAIDSGNFGQVAYLDATFDELKLLQPALTTCGNNPNEVFYYTSACHRWCIQRGYIGGTIVEIACPPVGCLCVK